MAELGGHDRVPFVSDVDRRLSVPPEPVFEGQSNLALLVSVFVVSLFFLYSSHSPCGRDNLKTREVRSEA